MQPSFVAHVNNVGSPRKPSDRLVACSPWSNAAVSIPTSPTSLTRNFWRCAISSMPLPTWPCTRELCCTPESVMVAPRGIAARSARGVRGGGVYPEPFGYAQGRLEPRDTSPLQAGLSSPVRSPRITKSKSGRWPEFDLVGQSDGSANS